MPRSSRNENDCDSECEEVISENQTTKKIKTITNNAEEKRKRYADEKGVYIKTNGNNCTKQQARSFYRDLKNEKRFTQEKKHF